MGNRYSLSTSNHVEKMPRSRTDMNSLLPGSRDETVSNLTSPVSEPLPTIERAPSPSHQFEKKAPSSGARSPKCAHHNSPQNKQLSRLKRASSTKSFGKVQRNSSCRSSAHEKPVTNDVLSRMDKKYVRTAWNRINTEKPNFIQGVWLRIFGKGMKLRSVFSLEAYNTDEEIIANRRVQTAVTGLRSFIDDCVNVYNLNHDLCGSAALEIGARHVGYEKSTIQAVHWDMFALELVEAFEEMGSAEDIDHLRDVVAWRKFINILMGYIVQSYRQTKTNPGGEFVLEEAFL